MTSTKVLLNLFEKESLKDVALKVEGDERLIKANRVILIVASKYFEALFTSEFSEKDSELVTIKGLNYDTLELLLKLIYTDELQFSDKCSLKDAFLAADYLMIDLALERLNAYALDNISQEIAMDILNLEGNVAVEVYEKAMEFFCKSLNIHRDIPALTIDQLMKVIKQLQNSSVSRLDTVVRSIPVWIKAAPSEREKYMFELLSIVEFRDNLLTTWVVEDLIPYCKDNESLLLVIALFARKDGYTGKFLTKYLNKI